MSTPAVEQPVPPKEALAWEAAQRQRAGICGILAAVLVLAGSVITGLVSVDQPHVLAVNALRDAVGEAPNTPGLRTPVLLFLNDHAVGLLAGAILATIGTALFIPILGYLHRAAAARSSRVGKIALYASLVGPAAVAVAGIVLQVAVTIQLSDFAGAADHTTKSAQDALGGSIIQSMSLLRWLGGLVVALALVLVSLNAMRVGLLTRFMGVLGIIAGALVLVGPVIAPQLSTLPIIEIFWLGAVGALVLRRWPGGNIPPAWDSGQAEPWPTQQELREQREQELARRKSEKAAKDDAEADVVAVSTMPVPRDDDEDGPAGAAHSSSKKKKRKRR
jgi:hypothetical protein